MALWHWKSKLYLKKIEQVSGVLTNCFFACDGFRLCSLTLTQLYLSFQDLCHQRNLGVLIMLMWFYQKHFYEKCVYLITDICGICRVFLFSTIKLKTTLICDRRVTWYLVCRDTTSDLPSAWVGLTKSTFSNSLGIFIHDWLKHQKLQSLVLFSVIASDKCIDFPEDMNSLTIKLPDTL